MKIPPEDFVKVIIFQVLIKKGIIHTQEELADVVEKELKKLNSEYSISPERVRRIALDMKELDVTVKTKKGGVNKPKKCPACGSGLKFLYARNLLGKNVIVGFKCKKCKYQGDVDVFAPMKYEFKIAKS